MFEDHSGQTISQRFGTDDNISVETAEERDCLMAPTDAQMTDEEQIITTTHERMIIEETTRLMQ